ncbi:hypothetical protein JCGZ_19213 [Jatropha curcas]|uniref:Uncharacterized protein n=1 Tax=Jatropha curcas TaxID=180498 RepID=A0A067L7C0_JATCU|nr:hypothetical protein JCGZ_19213 [Jatropha curcas]
MGSVNELGPDEGEEDPLALLEGKKRLRRAMGTSSSNKMQVDEMGQISTIMEISDHESLRIEKHSLVLALKELVRSHRLEILLLMEALVNKQRIDKLRVKLCFDGGFTMDSSGRSEGLAIY